MRVKQPWVKGFRNRGLVFFGPFSAEKWTHSSLLARLPNPFFPKSPNPLEAVKKKDEAMPTLAIRRAALYFQGRYYLLIQVHRVSYTKYSMI